MRKFKLQDRMEDVVEMAIETQISPRELKRRDGARQRAGRSICEAAGRCKRKRQDRHLTTARPDFDEPGDPCLVEVMRNEQLSNELRGEAIRNLAKIRGGAGYLIKQADEGNVPGELQQVAAASLHRAQWPDVRGEANRVYPISAAKDNKPLPSIAELSQKHGDVERGKTVFAKAGTCASCHLVKGQGKAVGPDLSEIGKKLSRDAMFESILYPSAGISHNYESYVAQTEDGNTVLGLLASETADFVEIKNIEGITQRIDRKAIEELVKQNVSLMPADLHKNLTEQELVDLVDYLMTLK